MYGKNAYMNACAFLHERAQRPEFITAGCRDGALRAPRSWPFHALAAFSILRPAAGHCLPRFLAAVNVSGGTMQTIDVERGVESTHAPLTETYRTHRPKHKQRKPPMQTCTSNAHIPACCMSALSLLSSMRWSNLACSLASISCIHTYIQIYT